MMARALRQVRTRGQWTADIRNAYGDSVESVLVIGRMLIEAKGDLPHGEFGRMIASDLPFGARRAQRLMAIAGNQALSNTTHASHLPGSWTTLYALSQIEAPKLEKLIENGDITPMLERKDVADLRGAAKKKTRSTVKKIAPAKNDQAEAMLSPVIACITDVRTRIDETFEMLTGAPEKRELITRLRHMLNEIERIEHLVDGDL